MSTTPKRSLLVDDEDFDFEFNRVLAHAVYRGSDTGEVLRLRSQIKPGDMNDWHDAFFALAQRAEASAGPPAKPDQISRNVSRTDRMFAASNYYRTADFFLHGDPDDPRIMSLWSKQTECFDEALKSLGNGTRHELKADGFTVPIIFFKTSLAEGKPRPVILIGNGYDGSMEEMLHINGFAALQRGYDVILYEGPGMPSVRRYQNLGWIPDWERVVTPVVDFALSQPDTDEKRVVLLGYSMGGNLAVRAAAFEHRLAAVLAVDGVFDLTSYLRLPPYLEKIRQEGSEEEFNGAFARFAFDSSTSTATRWGIQQGKSILLIPQHKSKNRHSLLISHNIGLWSFNIPTGSEFFRVNPLYSLAPVIDQVQCPVFVGDAEDDLFFKGQPSKLTSALGKRAHYRFFSSEEAAGLHCQVGAAQLLNSETFDWLENTLKL